MTRRGAHFAALAATAAAVAPEPLLAEAAEPSFDPVAYSRLRHAKAPLRFRFQANSAAAAKAWQKKLRLKVTELVGGFPPLKSPLKPRSLETKDLGSYTREKLVFTSREGMEVLAYLLEPKAVSKPAPVVICVPGHGRGVDDIVGLDEKGNERRDKAGYMHDYAIQVVEHGAAALALEPLAFGHRRDPINAARGMNANACQPSAGAALLLGETMIGWRVYDVMRAIDFIETRPSLHSRQVGCLGISGGGTCTLFAAALDERIQAALVSGYLCTFRDSILSLSHCMDNYVPGILNWAEMSDVAGLIAPRALFAETGEKDRIFPVAGFRESVAALKNIYGVFGAPQQFGAAIHPGEHVFDGREGLPFLLARLQAARPAV